MNSSIPYETLQKTPKRLRKVEELFEVAGKVLEECTIQEEENENSVEIIPSDNHKLKKVENFNTEDEALPRLFALEEVRTDFLIVKRNLLKLMNKCQTLMDGTTEMQIFNITASQIDAISQLSNSITLQIQTVLKLYKDLAEIEQLRIPPEQRKLKKNEEKNGVVYIGDTKSLLNIIKENT